MKIILQSGAFYIPGVRQRVMVQVSDPDQRRWGFELTARLNSNPENGQAGDLTPVDNFTQVICEDNAPKPCASGVMFITHTVVGSRNGTPNGATFQFDWTPPATNAGPVTFYVAGNAANGNGANTGDQIYTSSVQLIPAIPAVPSVSAANVVSAATSLAGPVAPNSWVTIFGSNLAATTRAWSASDFVNGTMPFSLDGVSVMVNLFGAPRLTYVGYISPTQINFLLPPDTSITAATVQVRNPAGMSTAVPITIQANAPQLFSIDGKERAGDSRERRSARKGGAGPIRYDNPGGARRNDRDLRDRHGRDDAGVGARPIADRDSAAGDITGRYDRGRECYRAFGSSRRRDGRSLPAQCSGAGGYGERRPATGCPGWNRQLGSADLNGSEVVKGRSHFFGASRWGAP